MSYLLLYPWDGNAKPWESTLLLSQLLGWSLQDETLRDCNPFLPQALNCIMEMVEKTRRSMAVLRRCQEADREELNYWKRRCSETAEPRKAGAELLSRQHSPASADSVGSGEQGWARRAGHAGLGTLSSLG